MLPANGSEPGQGVAVNPFVSSGHLETSTWSLIYLYECAFFIDQMPLFGQLLPFFGTLQDAGVRVSAPVRTALKKEI